MDERTEAEAIQNSAADEILPDKIDDRSRSQDSDGDGLTDRQEVLLGTDPDNADTDRDGVSDLQEVLLGTDPNTPDANRDEVVNGSEPRNENNLTTDRQQPPIVSDLYQWSQQQSSTDANQAQEPNLEPQQPPIVNDLYQWTQQRPNLNADLDRESDAFHETSSDTRQPAVIKDIYKRLQERTGLDTSQAAIAVYQGSELLYQSNSQSVEFDKFSSQIQDLLQKTLEDPTGLQGELAISVNGQVIFHVENGELKLDQYGLVSDRQVDEAQSSTQTTPSTNPQFDPAALHERYSQKMRDDSQSPDDIAPIDAFETIALTALDDKLAPEQIKQVLQQDPFYQNFALGMGKEQADSYSASLIDSLVDKSNIQGELFFLKQRVKSLESSSSNNSRTDVLEERIRSLESFNQQLSSQLDTVNQKLDKLSQSKAFQSPSLGLNQFLGKVSQSITNSLQATKNALRQKAGEISLSLLNASAKKSVEWFGEETKNGLRVIDTNNNQRLGINRQSDIWLSKSPDVHAPAQYQRLSQEVDKSLPPSLQLKEVAQAALKEQFTTSQVQSILSQSPKFQEISSQQGVNKASQFAAVAIAAAQRQNSIDARPKQQEQQQQKQHQA